MIIRCLAVVIFLVCVGAEAQECRNGQCRLPGKVVHGVAELTTATAQGVANIMARDGSLRHMGGHHPYYEGIGMGSTPDQALRNCCYYGRIKIVDQGVAQGRNGKWFACIRGR